MVRTIQASREIKQDFWEMNKRGSKQAQSKLHAETFLCSCCLQQWRVLRGDVALARLQLSRAPQLETELHNPPSVGSSPHTATQQAWSPLSPEDVLVQLFLWTSFRNQWSCLQFWMQLDSWMGTLPMVLALSDSWLTNRVIWEVALNQVMLLLYQYSPIMQTKWKRENNDYQIDTNHALCTLPAQSVWQSLIKSGHQQSTPPP